MRWYYAVIGVIIAVLSAKAEYVEIKTGDGYYYNTYSSGYYPYVCYDRRVKVVSDGIIYLRYDGCMRSRYSCGSIGKAHFGRYPSNRAARRALYRCRTATPRFID